MNLEEAVRDLGDARYRLPREAMQWALDHWEKAGPHFVELLERCASGEDRSETTRNALFFIVHVLGEKQETRAFSALCRILEDGELSESILSDAIAETLTNLLIATYNGDLAPLKKVIETPTGDDYARASAIEAMTYVARCGALADDEMRSYILHLYATMRPRAACFIWSAWALSVANLGYGDYSDKVQHLIRVGFIRKYEMTMNDFHEQLRRTLSDAERMAGFKYDRIEPITDTISRLSGWYCFSEEYQRRQEALTALSHSEFANSEAPFWLKSIGASALSGDQEEPDSPVDDDLFVSSEGEPVYKPFRGVGRNDPCPCGSGRKFKKCCLE